MKIDYELVEKIGATHYNKSSCGLYKVDGTALSAFDGEKWIHPGISLGLAVSLIKPIPPKPPVRVEYVGVHNGEAIKGVMNGSGEYFYCSDVDGEMYPLTMGSSLNEFCRAFKLIENPDEWWVDAVDFVEEVTGVSCASVSNDKLFIDAEMTRDQWCDFARILLEGGE